MGKLFQDDMARDRFLTNVLFEYEIFEIEYNLEKTYEYIDSLLEDNIASLCNLVHLIDHYLSTIHQQISDCHNIKRCLDVLTVHDKDFYNVIFYIVEGKETIEKQKFVEEYNFFNTIRVYIKASIKHINPTLHHDMMYDTQLSIHKYYMDLFDEMKI